MAKISNAVITYPGDRAAVKAMLLDPQYHRLRFTSAGFDDPEVVTETVGGQVQISVTATVPAQLGELAGGLKRFVSDRLVVKAVEVFEPDTMASTLALDITGAPVTVTGKTALSAGGENETTRTVEAQIKVTIPLLGASIENHLLGTVQQLVAAEEKIARTYLA